jgi:hypothetical protein
MLQPEQVTERLRLRFNRDYQGWARGHGAWPIKIGLQTPSTAERSADPVACHQWALAWKNYTGAGRVDYINLRFPTATHSMPRALVLDRPSQVAALHPETQLTWQRCGERLTHLQRTFPGAVFDGIIRRVTELSESDYQRLVATVDWLRTHPTSGMLLRQLPIEGIGTKWLLKHRVLVLALLGDREDPDFPEAAADQAADALAASARRRLHERLGLRNPPELVQVAVLDPVLRSYVGGMRHFAASIEDLSQWPCHPRTVIILENKETGYAITGDHRDTVVLHGLGFNVASYARIIWVHNARTVIYWGDIDAPGLQFVSDLRGYGISATTILMNIATLDSFRHLSTNGAEPQRARLPDLTSSEAELYAYLTEYAAAHKTGLLLEQERIPWAHAYETLMRTIEITATADRIASEGPES